MSDSAHARYAQRLNALATGVAILDVFTGTRLFQTPAFAQRHWVRTYGRFTPDRDSYATLCFETTDQPQKIVRVEVSTTRPKVDEHHTPVVSEQTLGWLCLHVLPVDPRLPTLAAVLASVTHATIIRYRPFRRCTLRVDGADPTRFVKVFPPCRRSAIAR